MNANSDYSELQAAGFIFDGDRNAAYCILCKLEISSWTPGFNLFSTHKKRSPNCAFVRSRLDSIQAENSAPYELSATKEFVVERPMKKQRMEESSRFYEVDRLKIGRLRSFSSWCQPATFIRQMIKAGFFSCNVDDRVICIYCNLICEKWNVEVNDPCRLHKIHSPTCAYVRAELHGGSLHCDNVVSQSPKHVDFTNPRERTASFSRWPNDRFPTVDKLVNAGFFYDGSSTTCFYCNGSFEHCESNNHPLAEHVRLFPYCDYARRLCGEELYRKIQRSIKPAAENIKTNGTLDEWRQSTVDDPETLSKLVADRLDLPISRYLISKENIERSVIERCWEYQLRCKKDDFLDNCDLRLACDILRKQNTLTQSGTNRIIIPSLFLEEIGVKRRIFQRNEDLPLRYLSTHTKQSYTDILNSFERDLEEHKLGQRELAKNFIEEESLCSERERSLKSWSNMAISRRDMMKAGWIFCDTQFCSICPHCQIHYYNWKATDDPLMVHKYLSPNCLFVLSREPLRVNQIPIRQVAENFTEEDIMNAESQPYKGLVQSKHVSFHMISDREASFDRYPNGRPCNAATLAKMGLYYTNIGKGIKCFYCEHSIFTRNHGSSSDLNLIPVYHPHCRYRQQLNDSNPVSSTRPASNKCTWCMTEDKKIMALPCRHFCLCEPCSLLKRLCPVCETEVTAFAIVYIP